MRYVYSVVNKYVTLKAKAKDLTSKTSSRTTVKMLLPPPKELMFLHPSVCLSVCPSNN